MGLADSKISIEPDTQRFLTDLVERLCASLDKVANVVSAKKVDAELHIK